ncbi:MAG TPA: type IV pilus modification protein PilV [Steroidobacteraceae bacterium]|jgi:type IV pilus assembly protein PilV|nr:type IV pilus modification protein PilV [Steroidobacteraceae bacterium]
MSVIRTRRQSGVSIVEALVALVVLSVGMLGIASLYLESVRSNRTALTRTAAVHLVNDLADRIRANRSAEVAYTVMPLGTVPPAAGVNCGSTVSCSPVQMAAYDLRAWYLQVQNALPVGSDTTLPQVSVEYVNGATVSVSDRYIITVGWKEPGSTDLLTTSVEVLQLGDQ